jgi:hypothetical protein
VEKKRSNPQSGFSPIIRLHDSDQLIIRIILSGIRLRDSIGHSPA